MDFEHLIVEREENIAVVTINRHERRNSLAAKTIEELGLAFDGLAADQNVAAVVVTGAGDKAFCAGADLEEGFDPKADIKTFVRAGQAVFQKIERFPKPVVAAVNGYAFGGGLELMLSCDISVVAEGVALGQPEIGRGVMPGWGATQKIPRIAGKNRAMEILLLGNRFRPEQAKELGLVNLIVQKGEALKEAKGIAKRLGKQPAYAVRLIKDAVTRGCELELDAGLEIEAENFAEAFNMSDMGEKSTKGDS